ncbi:MAG TPA: acyl-CoA dehydrogenase family protein [Candidatus Obscuribacterales bacterium]
MVEYNLTDEKREFQKLARDFAQREIAPRAEHFDKTAEFPCQIIEKIWECGLLNVQIPDEAGGLALSLFDACLIAEELASGCSGIAGCAEASAIAQLPVLLFGSGSQKTAYLKPLVDQPLLAGFAPSIFSLSGSSEDFSCRAKGGDFELSGKGLVVNGAQSEWFVIAASPDGESLSANGGHAAAPLSLFVVPAKSNGVVIGDARSTLGRKALQSSVVELHGVVLSKEHLIGQEKKANEVLPAFIARAYALMAAGLTGLARSAMQHAIAYSKERHTFGRPISDHQAVAFMLADMAKDIQAARLLVYTACELLDRGDNAFDEASLAKLFAQEMAMRVTTDAVQVFGGYGYSREYPVEKLMRDAKVYQLYGGVNVELAADIGRRAIAAGQI